MFINSTTMRPVELGRKETYVEVFKNPSVREVTSILRYHGSARFGFVDNDVWFWRGEVFHGTLMRYLWDLGIYREWLDWDVRLYFERDGNGTIWCTDESFVPDLYKSQLAMMSYGYPRVKEIKSGSTFSNLWVPGQKENSMDIGYFNEGVASRLSNFTKRPFVFDGVQCNSMEGLLQAFKFENKEEQISVCLLTGMFAKKCGADRIDAWKSAQTLWWDGIAYKRSSAAYQVLLDRAYDALATNWMFCDDLISTGDEDLVHSIGGNNMKETILTEREFCKRLTNIRKRLANKEQ